jgi:hypothetical protein
MPRTWNYLSEYTVVESDNTGFSNLRVRKQRLLWTAIRAAEGDVFERGSSLLERMLTCSLGNQFQVIQGRVLEDGFERVEG